uniref:Uncharacterized protein n=1 Tax=Chromera velia CCMP2878 TaxID=1169474 RepID=A0A0G4GDM7_9ALVE|eukprot:Cvel_21339.t1-p1 / transcript=Cvel_21339.t1 / gene=Cvel_21339 / organism=Chromera_velia_CCMP2878 / gene_product=Putative leucine-rich repeat-containing protein, putative / transcript_product=Putative leucine-rich repeat-containing protein, putative / location=Cvel_scaffold1991:8699-12128(+) / protein_length=469 / sequence_SO=supercontig / SO=protein_coding / is_pseudo=false
MSSAEDSQQQEATVHAFANWLVEMKLHNSSNLKQMLSEIGLIRDGITMNSTDLSEFRRKSTSVQQQMQSQLSDLREKLSQAFAEIGTLGKQKAAADVEFSNELSGMQSTLGLKSSELEAFKRDYSNTHLQLQNHLIQVQNRITISNNEVEQLKKSAQTLQEQMIQKFLDVEEKLTELTTRVEKDKAEENRGSANLQRDIAGVHEKVTSLSSDFGEFKRISSESLNAMQRKVWLLEEARDRGLTGAMGLLSPSTQTQRENGQQQQQEGAAGGDGEGQLGGAGRKGTVERVFPHPQTSVEIGQGSRGDGTLVQGQTALQQRTVQHQIGGFLAPPAAVHAHGGAPVVRQISHGVATGTSLYQPPSIQGVSQPHLPQPAYALPAFPPTASRSISQVPNGPPSSRSPAPQPGAGSMPSLSLRGAPHSSSAVAFTSRGGGTARITPTLAPAAGTPYATSFAPPHGPTVTYAPQRR